MNGVNGRSENVQKHVAAEFRLITEGNFKKSYLEEIHVKEKQRAKENATPMNVQVLNFFKNWPTISWGDIITLCQKL